MTTAIDQPQRRIRRSPRARTLQTTVLWFVAIGLTALGLSPLLQVPVIQDDLQLLLAGLAEFAEGNANFSSSINAAHVVPGARIVTTIVQGVVYLASFTFISPHDAWALLRIAWPIAALLSSSLFLAIWLPKTRIPLPARGRPFLLLFAMQAALLVATLQVHAVWSNDPTVSYPVAGWGSAILGFLFLASLSKALYAEHAGPGWLIATTGLGLFTILTYEILASALVAAAVLVSLLPREQVSIGRRVRVLSMPIGVPLLVFVLSQAWRLLQPVVYTGTEPGAISSIPTTLIPALISSLPLTTLPLSSTQLAAAETQTSQIWPVVAGALLLTLLAACLYRGTQGGTTGEKHSDQRTATVGVLGAILAFWLASTFIVSTSVRYQSDLNGEIGKVYVFYAIGAISVVSLITIGLLMVLQRRELVGWTTAALIIAIVSLVTAFTNSRSIVSLQQGFRHTTQMLDQLTDDSSTDASRCAPLISFTHSGLPIYYVDDVVARLQSYSNSRFNRQYCPSERLYLESPFFADASGDTHGFEQGDRKQVFWWMSGPESTITIGPSPLNSSENKFELILTAAPCDPLQQVTVSTRTTVQTVDLSRGPIFMEFILPRVGERILEVRFLAREPACLIPTDARPLTFRVDYPVEGKR